MKKLFSIIFCLVLCLFAFNVWADSTAATTTTAPATTITTNTSTPITLGPINVGGDTIFVTGGGATRGFAAGVGMDIASAYNGILKIHADAAVTTGANTMNLLGLGPQVNVTQLISHLSGWTWMANFNTAIGIEPLINLNGTVKIKPAIVLSILQIPL